ncbi:hypothetical protein KW791_01240 [Candidatus Parcubacteria bacterium]|nr:hypothetical protein [Candidatus Parcubacteria bacterium]
MTLTERLIQEGHILSAIKAALSMGGSVFERRPRVSTPGPNSVYYASSPITTGKRMFDVMKQHNVQTVEALKEIDPNIVKNVIMDPNIRDGQVFSQELRKTRHLVICPGDFFAKGWAQQHYMAFWEQIIVRYVDVIVFNDLWQYSNGCVEEFFIGLQHSRGLYTRELEPIDVRACISKIKDAVNEIDGQGYDANKLYDLHRRIDLFNDAKLLTL